MTNKEWYVGSDDDRRAKEAMVKFVEYAWACYLNRESSDASKSIGNEISEYKTSDEAKQVVEKQDRVMTLKEASREYFRGNVGYNKLLAMAKNGELPVKLIGSRYFTKKGWLDQWLDDSFKEQSEKRKDKPFGALRQLK